MELRHLRYFIAIAEERNFTRAAERLWVAQPGLSTQIRRLEAELGVQLFERHTRGVDLTEAGRLFLQRAREAVRAAEFAADTGRDFGSGMVGSVRLGLCADAQASQSATLLEEFCRTRPNVELTITEAYGGTLWRDLRDGHLDAVIAPDFYGSADLRTLALGVEPWVVLVGYGHRLGGSGPVSAHDLAGEDVIVSAHRDAIAYDRAVGALLADLGVLAALRPSQAGPLMQMLVAEGAGVAFATAAGTTGPGVTARPLSPQVTMSFVLLWRNETPSPALSEFVRVAHRRSNSGADRPQQLVAA